MTLYCINENKLLATNITSFSRIVTDKNCKNIKKKYRKVKNSIALAQNSVCKNSGIDENICAWTSIQHIRADI